MNDNRWIIYFIRCGKGPIKIGITVDLLNRFETLQLANHEELSLVRAIHGTRETENELHERFAGNRIRGEWFEATDTLLSYVEALPNLLAENFNKARHEACACGKARHDLRERDDGSFVGLCRRCAMEEDGRLENFLKVAKRERPVHPPKPCSNCAVPSKPIRRGRCHACNEYFRRNGAERPLDYVERCSNCKSSGAKISRGRCRKCYHYWRVHKVERPLEGKEMKPLGLKHSKCLEGHQKCAICQPPLDEMKGGKALEKQRARKDIQRTLTENEEAK